MNFSVFELKKRRHNYWVKDVCMTAKKFLGILLLLACTSGAFSAVPNTASEGAAFEGQETHPAIIELLQNGESYSIEITSVGCFGGNRQTITISRDADVLTASYPDFSKILSDQDVQAFINFEHQLRIIEVGGCSTVDTYVLRYGNDEFRTSDGTCSWNGGKKLLKEIS